MRNQSNESASAKIDVANLEKRSERFKLNFFNESYQVNKAKNTVTCILNYEILSPYDISDTHTKVLNNGYDGNIIPRMAFTSIGISRCQGNDVFDAEKGRKIAKAHAENKAYGQATSLILKRLKSFDRIAQLFHFMVEQFQKKTQECVQHNIKYIERISE